MSNNITAYHNKKDIKNFLDQKSDGECFFILTVSALNGELHTHSKGYLRKGLIYDYNLWDKDELQASFFLRHIHSADDTNSIIVFINPPSVIEHE